MRAFLSSTFPDLGERLAFVGACMVLGGLYLWIVGDRMTEIDWKYAFGVLLDEPINLGPNEPSPFASFLEKLPPSWREEMSQFGMNRFLWKVAREQADRRAMDERLKRFVAEHPRARVQIP